MTWLPDESSLLSSYSQHYGVLGTVARYAAPVLLRSAYDFASSTLDTISATVNPFSRARSRKAGANFGKSLLNTLPTPMYSSRKKRSRPYKSPYKRSKRRAGLTKAQVLDLIDKKQMVDTSNTRFYNGISSIVPYYAGEVMTNDRYTYFPQVAQGSDYNTREGNKMKIQSVKVNFLINRADATIATDQLVRVILLYARNWSGTGTDDISSFFSTSSSQLINVLKQWRTTREDALADVDTKTAFDILFDKTYLLADGSVPVIKDTIFRKWPKGLLQRYHGSVGADSMDGFVFLAISSDGTPANIPTVFFDVGIKFSA